MDQELKRILFDLIKIDSSQKEEACADYIIEYLRRNTDFAIDVQDIAPGRKNVIARKGRPKVVLAGHLDTVSFTRSEWPGLDPLEPVEKDGKVYGRGAVDMKAGLSIMLKLAREFKGDDLMLIFTVGEETDFMGIEHFVSEYKSKKDFNPELFVFLEPTDLFVSNKHKGLYECRYTIRGKSEHSSRPETGNHPGKLMLDLFSLEDEIKRPEFADKETGIFPTINFGNGQFGLEREFDAAKLSSLPSEVQDELTGSRICLFDRRKVNSVPNIFEFCFDIRTTKPFEDAGGIDLVEKFIAASAAKRGLSIIKKEVINDKPSLYVEKEKYAELRRVVESATGSADSKVFKAGYTEAGIVRAALGIPAVNFGPAPANMAHCPAEYVTVDSLEKAYGILDRFINS